MACSKTLPFVPYMVSLRLRCRSCPTYMSSLWLRCLSCLSSPACPCAKPQLGAAAAVCFLLDDDQKHVAVGLDRRPFPAKHGLSSDIMALIASDCVLDAGTARRARCGPNHLANQLAVRNQRDAQPCPKLPMHAISLVALPSCQRLTGFLRGSLQSRAASSWAGWRWPAWPPA